MNTQEFRINQIINALLKIEQEASDAYYDVSAEERRRKRLGSDGLKKQKKKLKVLYDKLTELIDEIEGGDW